MEQSSKESVKQYRKGLRAIQKPYTSSVVQGATSWIKKRIYAQLIILFEGRLWEVWYNLHKFWNSPVASALRAIYMSATQMQAKENFERFKREYQAEYPQVVKDWERELEDILTFYKYP